MEKREEKGKGCVDGGRSRLLYLSEKRRGDSGTRGRECARPKEEARFAKSTTCAMRSVRRAHC